MAEDIDDVWFDYAVQFVTKLSNAKNDWDSLREEEREIAALWKWEADVYNGGFIQFFLQLGI